MFETIESHSSYLLGLFQAKLSVVAGAACPQVPPPAGMTLTLMSEYEMAATHLNMAYRSPGMLYSSLPSGKHVLLPNSAPALEHQRIHESSPAPA